MEDSSSEEDANGVDEYEVDDEVIDLTNEDDNESSKEDDSPDDENIMSNDENETRREDDLSIQYISSGEDDGLSDDERYMVSDDDDDSDDDSGDDDADDGYEELLNDYEDVNRRPYMVQWMVQSNDPRKLELCIHKRSLPIDGSPDEEYGAHIGRNTCLRQLKLARPNLKLQFFQGLSLNRSIMKLSLVGRYPKMMKYYLV